MRDIFWGGRFLPYRQQKVNETIASGKHEKLSPTPEIVVTTHKRGSGISIHGWTRWQIDSSGRNGYAVEVSTGTKISFGQFRVVVKNSTW